MAFITASFGSPNEDVRKVAVKCVVECYKQVGRKIDSQTKGLKKQVLEVRCSRVSNIPTQTDAI